MGHWLKYQVKEGTENTNGISLQRQLTKGGAGELELLVALNSNLLTMEKTSGLPEELVIRLKPIDVKGLKSALEKYLLSLEDFSYSETMLVEHKIKSKTKVSHGLSVLVDPERYSREVELLLELASGVKTNMTGVGYVVTLTGVEAADVVARLTEFLDYSGGVEEA